MLVLATSCRCLLASANCLCFQRGQAARSTLALPQKRRSLQIVVIIFTITHVRLHPALATRLQLDRVGRARGQQNQLLHGVVAAAVAIADWLLCAKDVLSVVQPADPLPDLPRIATAFVHNVFYFL